MRKYGLIGFPLGHSFSKRYFTEKFANEGITGCSYENFPIESIHKLEGLIDSESELSGLNVTIPYKSSVLGFLNYIDPEASAINAVNVIKIKYVSGRKFLAGYNSDIKGIDDTLSPVLSGIRQALVLGTGGSSKAVCHVLQKAGVRITLVSREARSNILSYADLTPGRIACADLIVNTTPLGMYPEIYSKPDIAYQALKARHVLFDLVYNPEMTAFLAEGTARGCTTLGGLKMLISQAERAWEIWNDDKY